jgi:hypothetical protein
MRTRANARRAARSAEGSGKRLSYANVMATIAAFAALATGGAYASGLIGATDIKDNAIRSRHIKAGQVKTPDLADGAVTEAKLAEPVEGAISIDRQFARADSVFNQVTVVNGVAVKILCSESSDSVLLRIDRTANDQGLYAWGTKAIDGTLTRLSAADGSPPAYYLFAGADTVEMDVVAELSEPGQPVRTTRFDLSGVRGTACNFHGLIAPASSVG